MAKKRTHIAVMTAEGAILRSRPVRNTPMDFAAFFDDLPHGRERRCWRPAATAAMVQDLVERYVERLTLCHPLKTRAIASARIKNDQLDATTLAHLLQADLIPPAHRRLPAVRERQQLLRQYTFFVAARTRLKQRIHLSDRSPALGGAPPGLPSARSPAGPG